MDKKFIQKVFSNERTQKYFDLHQEEEKAMPVDRMEIVLKQAKEDLK